MQTRRLHQLGPGANENGRVDANDDRLWVVDLGGGQLRVVQGRAALKELIASHDLPSTARAYELSAVPKTLGEIPEVAPAFETTAPAARAAPVVEEAVVAPAQETLAPAPAPEPEPEPAKAELEVVAPASPPEGPSAAPVVPKTVTPSHNRSHDAEFSLLDRPFDDADYFEDPPRRQWPRIAGFVAVVACLVGGGYKLTHPRDGAVATVAPTTRETTLVVPASSPAPAQAPAAAAEAPAAAMAAPAAAPAPLAPLAPVPAQVQERLPDPPVPPAPLAAPSPSYAALVAEGQRQFDRGHGRKAQELFEQALAEQPDGTDALVGLAYAELDRGKMQDAIGSFKRALEQDGSHARAVFGLAESYRQQGNRSAALATFKRFLKLQPSGPDADIARRLVQDLNAGG
jgi:hypothetical protein